MFHDKDEEKTTRGFRVSAALLLTSMSPELLPGNAVVAGTMGLLLGGAVGLEPCWGMLGETGSTLTMAGAEPRQTDGDRTTAGEDPSYGRSEHLYLNSELRLVSYQVGSGPWRAGPAG